jgi:hypothetical protein
MAQLKDRQKIILNNIMLVKLNIIYNEKYKLTGKKLIEIIKNLH